MRACCQAVCLRFSSLRGCGPTRAGLVLAGDEGLLVAGAVGVEAAGGAAPGGGAGDGVDDGEPVLVERGGARDFFGGAPGAVAGGGDEGLGVTGAVCVIAAGAAPVGPPAG